MKSEDVQALREGQPLSDRKLEALRLFTRSLIHNRVHIVQGDLEAFFKAGWTKEQSLEVVLGIAVKTMSNYTNSITGTPLERAVQRLKWRKPTFTLRFGDSE